LWPVIGPFPQISQRWDIGVGVPWDVASAAQGRAY
jgi:hypothetical protein